MCLQFKKSLEDSTFSSSKVKPLPRYLQGWTILILILKHSPRSHLSLSHSGFFSLNSFSSLGVPLFTSHLHSTLTPYQLQFLKRGCFSSLSSMASQIHRALLLLPSGFAHFGILPFWYSALFPHLPGRMTQLLVFHSSVPCLLSSYARLVFTLLLWIYTLVVTCECMQLGLTLCKVLSYILFSHSVVSDSFVTRWTVVCQLPLSLGFPRQEH